MGESATPKICRICGDDCAGRPRTKDRRGRYYCKACYERALAAQRSSAATPAAPAAPADDDGYGLLGEITAAPSAGAPLDAPPSAGEVGPGVRCPSCDRRLPGGTVICVDCGINVVSGRSVVMSRGLDENQVYVNTESVLRLVSWVVPLSLFPVASEAMGTRKPWAIQGLVVLTCLVSIWFWFSTPAQMQSRKSLMQWSGEAADDPFLLEEMYLYTNWGDAEAFQRRLVEMEREEPAGGTTRSAGARIVAAHESLTPRQRATGEFRPHQLVTHQFLHGDILHLAGNMVFLLIIGSRVNALLGTVATLLLYPLLGILAGFASHVSLSGGPAMAGLGASGAIMGMAGMYLVFFPLNRIHIAGWIRMFLFFFRMRIWVVPGIIVLLFWIAWDVFYVVIGAETGTDHWAHLGGFIAGVVIALALLMTRVLSAGGGDLLSVTLGRHAWPLIGRPSEHAKPGFSLPRFGDPA